VTEQALLVRLAAEQAERDRVALEQSARLAQEQAQMIAALTEKIGNLQTVNVTNHFNLNFFF
jgi:hypothetical protein